MRRRPIVARNVNLNRRGVELGGLGLGISLITFVECWKAFHSMSFLFAIPIRFSQSRALFALRGNLEKTLVDTEECRTAVFYPPAQSTETKFPLIKAKRMLRDWRNWKFTNIFQLSIWEKFNFKHSRLEIVFALFALGDTNSGGGRCHRHVWAFTLRDSVAFESSFRWKVFNLKVKAPKNRRGHFGGVLMQANCLKQPFHDSLSFFEALLDGRRRNSSDVRHHSPLGASFSAAVTITARKWSTWALH